MPENTDLARNSLEDLLCGVAKSSKGKQASIAVEAPKQSFRWTGSAGKTETGEPISERTPFFIASIDKLYNATIAMMLAESGKPLHIPLLIKSVKGIYSTAADMMKFIRRLMQCELFGNPDTLTAMTSRWHRFGFPMDRAALRSPSWPIEYAIGMMRFRVPRLFTLFAPMPEVVGHTGSTGCWLFYCPELEVTIAGSVEDAAAGAVPFRTTPEILKVLHKTGWQAHGAKG